VGAVKQGGGGRIVLVSHSREVGGAELHLERLVGFLVGPLGSGEPSYRLELICRPDPVLDAWAGRIAAAGVTVHRLSLNGPTGVIRLTRIIRGARLVHLHIAHAVGKYQLIAALTARLAGRRSLATHHLALDVRDVPIGRRRRAIWFRLFRWWLHSIDRHIAVSTYAKGILTGIYGVDASRISVIYVGTDVRMFRPAGPDERAGLRHQLFGELAGVAPPADLCLVCSVARLSPQKGLGDLVEAARQLAPTMPSLKYVVIGGGQLSSALSVSLTSSGLERTILLAGNRSSAEVARWLQATDLFVLSSHFEGGPATALIEAMASGCAVVATRVSGSDELVPTDEYGILVEARRPEALAAAIGMLSRDPERLARLGRRARERVIGGFDIRQCHAQTLELYRAMLR